MTLVSEEVHGALLDGLAGYAQLGASGGSAANTVVGLAQLGGKAFFTGKVGGDMQGALYRESMAEVGVEFDVEAANGAPTGSCLVLVTPDGERTMQTSLGASAGLAADDVDVERIAQSQLIYVEGYLFGSTTTGAAAERAMEAASTNGTKVSLTLSGQPFSKPLARTREYVDILFCNEHEARIYAGGGDREDVIRSVGQDCPQVFMTCGGDGSMAYDHGTIVRVDGYQVPVVDTTGAGDVYAAGVLYGLTSGMSVAEAGKLGSFASAKIVTQLGPRLRERL